VFKTDKHIFGGNLRKNSCLFFRLEACNVIKLLFSFYLSWFSFVLVSSDWPLYRTYLQWGS